MRREHLINICAGQHIEGAAQRAIRIKRVDYVRRRGVDPDRTGSALSRIELRDCTFRKDGKA
jgi:hypothetical protein